MSAVDRPALAAALRVATPEILREDAASCHIALAHAGNDHTAASLQRLAALALAVSEAMAFDSRVEQAGGRDFLILDIGLPDAHGLGYGGCDLPAALAALVEGAA